MQSRDADAQDANLIADFQARRESALATAYRLYWRTLYKTAHDVLHEREDAEDCVHDVLVDVWASIELPPRTRHALHLSRRLREERGAHAPPFDGASP